MNHTYVAIMAGGIGSRFWPGSRVERPKQFLDMMGTGKSLIRQTFERCIRLCPAENIFVLTNSRYKALVMEHLPEITENQILCEPSRNNTAPCIAYTAFKLKNLDPKATFLVASSDAIIKDEDEYVRIVHKGIEYASNNPAIVTIGIKPSRPDEGYGYIRFVKDEHSDLKKVLEFTEKPDRKKAEAFYKSGDYLWNSGMFIWSVETVLSSFKDHATDIYDLFNSIEPYYNTSEEQAKIDVTYPTSRKISVDYAIMENAENVYTIPADFGWSDLGTWNSLHEEAPEKDEQKNVIVGDHVLLEETNNSLIRVPKDKLVVVRGLKDYIIVDEGDVLLIYPKAKEQEIKKLTEKIREESADKFL